MMTTRKQQILRRVGWVVLYTSLGVLVVAVLATLLQTYALTDQIRESQKDNSKTVTNSADTLRYIKDCTEPSGECYREGQERTADAVQDISQAVAKASLYASYCVHRNPDRPVAAIERCVKRQFEIADRKR